MPTKTRKTVRDLQSRGVPTTPPTSLPLANRRPRRAAARGPAPAPEAAPASRPQRGRGRKATPAQSNEEPSAESASVSAAESATDTVPSNEQGSAVVTGSPERDDAVYENRENPTVSLNPILVPEDDAVQSPREEAPVSLIPTVVTESNAVQSPREEAPVSLIPTVVTENNAVQSPRENASVPLIPTLVPKKNAIRSVRAKKPVLWTPHLSSDDEDDSMDSDLDPPPPPKQWLPPSRARRLRNGFTYHVDHENSPPITSMDPDGSPIISKDPVIPRDHVEPVAPQSTLHLLVTGPDGERTMAFTLPAAAASAIIDDLTSKYKLVSGAPKLTLDAGKREAPAKVVPDDARPTQRPRFDNAPSLDHALKGKVSHPNWSHLQREYYQQRQDKPGHSQHYRMVEPYYDENGMMAWPKADEQRRFIPILDEADDSDLDTELDEASSSFKENIPVISENDSVENIKDSEPSDAMVNSPGAGAYGPEEGAIVLQEDDVGDENIQDAPAAPAAQIPETPRSRWALGNIINTASKYIPRLGRVPEAPIPSTAGPVLVLPTENSTTPIQPTSPASQIAPRTEPHHPTRTPPTSKPDSKSKRAHSVHNYHINGPPRTKEDRARLNVRRRQEKVKKRKELDQIGVKMAELDAKRALMARQVRIWQTTKEEHEAKQAKARETYEMEYEGTKFRLRTYEKFDRERVKGPLFGPPRAPNAPGSRIKEARAEAKRKRRENSPKVIPGPEGGGYGMNEKYFYTSESDSDDTAADSPRTKKPRLEEAKDSSMPVGDPHQAWPATGTYFNDESNEPQLHGGNAFRETDAAEETMARTAKAKGSGPKIVPMTPDGKEITNLSGHFTVPYGSDSDTGSDEDNFDIPTPAPKRSVKESLSEMSIFRNDARERAASAPPKKSTDPPPRAESLPPIPPAPTPAHARLPGQPRYTPNPNFKRSERTTRYLLAAQEKSDKLRDEQEKLRAVRAKALQFTPRRSSNLRESHLVDSSPSAPSGQSTAKPSGKRVHFADDLISGPSRAAVSETPRTAVVESSKAISEPSAIVSDLSQAVAQTSQASSEPAQVITGAAQASSGTTQASPKHTPAFTWPAQVYPGPTQAPAAPAQASSGSSSLADDNIIVDDVDTTRYSKDEMITYGGMEVRGEVLNHAINAIRDEDVEFELDQIREEFAQFARENPSQKPVVSSRVQDFLDSDACRRAIEEDSGPIAEGIRASMVARDILF